MISSRSRFGRAAIMAIAALFLAAGHAEARAGRGGSGFGSRGARTFDAPAATRTAPTPLQPIQRSTTPQPTPGVNQPQAGPGMAQPARPGLFGNRGGFFGGLLGAGLLGMLLGYGLFGGFAGFASVLGLLLQMALIAGVVVLALRWFQGRSQPVPAGPAVPPLRRDAYRGQPTGGLGAAPRHRAGDDQVGLAAVDFDAFERILGELQDAYGRGDRATIRRLALPEVVGRLEQDLDEDAARNRVNRVSGAKLLQGDLAEAWREGMNEYATVAMRFSLLDHVEDLATSRTVEGDARQPVEATEVWTFRRDGGGPWRVSAIQEA